MLKIADLLKLSISPHQPKDLSLSFQLLQMSQQLWVTCFSLAQQYQAISRPTHLSNCKEMSDWH